MRTGRESLRRRGLELERRLKQEADCVLARDTAIADLDARIARSQAELERMMQAAATQGVTQVLVVNMDEGPAREEELRAKIAETKTQLETEFAQNHAQKLIVFGQLDRLKGLHKDLQQVCSQS